MNKQIIEFLVLTFLIAPCQLLALEAGVDLNVGVGHSNNSLKTHDNERSELEQRLGADLRLEHSGESVAVDADYSAMHILYDKDTQRDETVVTGDASITYEQIKQTLIWSLSNRRRNMVRDKGLDDVQNNREDRSITDAEATFILRSSHVDSLATTLSYSDVSYKDTDEQDSDSVGLNLMWARKLSKVDNLLLSASYQDVSFDAAVNNYEYYSAGVGYNTALSKLRYDIFIGYNEQDREDGNVGGGFYSANVGYSDDRSTWALALLQRLTDTSRGSDNISLGELAATGSFDGGIDSYKLTSAELRYENTWLCPSCVAGVSFLAVDESYETFDDDNTEISIATELSYRFTPRITFLGSVRYSDLNFKGLNIRTDYDFMEYRLAIRQQVAKDLLLVLNIFYEERNSNAILEEYDELRGGLSLTYTLR